MNKNEAQSKLVLPDSLDLFSVPLTAVGIESSRFTAIGTEVSPEITPWTFRVMNQRCYLGLNKSFFKIRFKITDAKGDDIDTMLATEKVAPVNMIGGALFKQITMYIGGKVVGDTGPVHPYRHYLQNILSYGHEYKSTVLAASGYKKEEKTDATDPAYKWRISKTENSKEWEVVCFPSLEMFCQPRLLIPFCDVKLVVYPSDANFALQRRAGTLGYGFKVTGLEWIVQEVFPHENLSVAVETALRDQRHISYPVVSLTTRTFLLPAGRRIVPEARLGLTKVPRRVAVVLVNAKAFQGDIKEDPFYFLAGNLTNISLSAGGHIIPHQPYRLDYSNDFYMRAYLALVEGMGLSSGVGGSGIGITPDMFKNGSAIYVFDIDGGNTDSTANFSLTKMGDISLSMEFSADIPDGGYYAICLCESDGLIQITANREAVVDSVVS